jgi:hypothetical protein
MEQWEYDAYIYDWGTSQLEVRRSGTKRALTWTGMWAHFNELGDQGWEMITATPVSDARWGNPDSNTTRMLFVFKRRRALSSSPATEPLARS